MEQQATKSTDSGKQWWRDVDVAAHYGFHRCTVWELVKAGLLPAPVAIGHRAKRWHVSTIDAHDRALVNGEAA